MTNDDAIEKAYAELDVMLGNVQKEMADMNSMRQKMHYACEVMKETDSPNIVMIDDVPFSIHDIPTMSLRYRVLAVCILNAPDKVKVTILHDYAEFYEQCFLYLQMLDRCT